MCQSGMVYTQDEVPIAMMDREPGNGTYGAERDCNAHLIAAAPELLGALERIDALAETAIRMEHDTPGLTLRAIVDIAFIARGKAKG